jgi:hypothetical protein
MEGSSRRRRNRRRSRSKSILKIPRRESAMAASLWGKQRVEMRKRSGRGKTRKHRTQNMNLTITIIQSKGRAGCKTWSGNSIIIVSN